LKLSPVKDFAQIPGQGIEGVCSGVLCAVRKPTFTSASLSEKSPEEQEKHLSSEEKPLSTVYEGQKF
jgi:cation transport ATPase